MTVISANGKTKYGDLEIRVTGSKRIDEIECDPAVSAIIENAIRNADGEIANGYHPEGWTMLQAYAYLTGLFGYDAVTVDGDLEEIPGGEEGVIY